VCSQGQIHRMCALRARRGGRTVCVCVCVCACVCRHCRVRGVPCATLALTLYLSIYVTVIVRLFVCVCRWSVAAIIESQGLDGNVQFARQMHAAMLTSLGAAPAPASATTTAAIAATGGGGLLVAVPNMAQGSAAKDAAPAEGPARRLGQAVALVRAVVTPVWSRVAAVAPKRRRWPMLGLIAVLLLVFVMQLAQMSRLATLAARAHALQASQRIGPSAYVTDPCTQCVCVCV
jgi:hypothetical protein